MKTYKITFILLFVSALAFCNVSNKEKEALISLYNATQGQNWMSSWNLESPVSTWDGVTVEDNKVIALDLSFNNLQGQLPEQIGDLIYLKELVLFRNKLEGSIPASIGNLNELKVLNLAFNKLEGTLPDSIGNLTSLVTLEAFMNNLEGEIPTTIGQ